MKNIKEKAKNIWDDHFEDIMNFGVATGLVLITGLCMHYAYKDGLKHGLVIGGLSTMISLDDKYPEEANCTKLFMRYINENP